MLKLESGNSFPSAVDVFEVTVCTEACDAFDASIETCAIKVDKSDVAVITWGEFFAAASLAWESFSVLVGIVSAEADGVFAAALRCAFEARAAAWMIIAERSFPGENIAALFLTDVVAALVGLPGSVVEIDASADA